jgi:hypothetical protein
VVPVRHRLYEDAGRFMELRREIHSRVVALHSGSHYHAPARINAIPITATFQISERTIGNPAV